MPQVDASLAKPFLAACRLPSDFSLAFSPPTAVTLVGSFALRTLARPSAVVDVAVEVPRGCLHPKDHVNYRYLGKRALFVAHLAKALTKAGLYKQARCVVGCCAAMHALCDCCVPSNQRTCGTWQDGVVLVITAVHCSCDSLLHAYGC